MRSEKLSKLIDNKAFRIVFSLLISLTLWGYVEFVENPESSLTLNNIPVEYVGAEVLAENNLVVTEQDTETVNVRFTGKRNMVTRLNRDEITATVDLTEILSNGASTGVYQLSYSLDYPSDITGLSHDGTTTDYVTVTVEKLISKRIRVRTQFNGDVRDGYRAKDPTCTLEEIVVSGSQAIISDLDYALAVVSGEDVTNTISQEIDLVLMDNDGNEVDTSGLTLSQETTTVTLQVQRVKEVPLVVNVVEGLSATAANTTITYSTNAITLAGDPKVLEDVQQIVLGTVDLTDFASTGSYTFPITLPNETENLSGVTTVKVNFEVVGMATARFSVDNITLRENTEGYVADIVTQSLDVLLRGPQESLNRVRPENIRIVADLSSIGNATGSFSAPATVYIDGVTDVDAIGNLVVFVNVTQGDG